MIQIKDLHKSYHMGNNSLHVLKGINFDVKEGLNTGIYIVKVQQGTQVLTKKLALVF